MSKLRFYGHGLPGAEDVDIGGKLIVLEGPDGVGRSTQVALLREWLEANGYAVFSSGFKRSELASRGIESAKQGHTMGNLTLALFYAADFADRLEREIIPMLKAGFVVLTDRYIYSMMARARVRGPTANGSSLSRDSLWCRTRSCICAQRFKICSPEFLPLAVLTFGSPAWTIWGTLTITPATSSTRIACASRWTR